MEQQLEWHQPKALQQLWALAKSQQIQSAALNYRV
jgi:hypothetical protein